MIDAIDYPKCHKVSEEIRNLSVRCIQVSAQQDNEGVGTECIERGSSGWSGNKGRGRKMKERGKEAGTVLCEMPILVLRIVFNVESQGAQRKVATKCAYRPPQLIELLCSIHTKF